MSQEFKTLADELARVKGDPCLTNLYFRYLQGLDGSYSHWRESMSIDKIASGEETLESLMHNRPLSKRARQEAELLASNPKADANVLWLQQKYGSRDR